MCSDSVSFSLEFDLRKQQTQMFSVDSLQSVELKLLHTWGQMYRQTQIHTKTSVRLFPHVYWYLEEKVGRK